MDWNQILFEKNKYFICQLFSEMKMPVLADIKKTQEELSLALAELDNIEAAVSSFERSRPSVQAPRNDQVENQLRDRVEFLNQENKELSQVTIGNW